MSEPLHVANGHCTTRLIEEAGLPGRTPVWANPHDGPALITVSAAADGSPSLPKGTLALAQ